MSTIKLYNLGNNQLKLLQATKLFSIDNFSSWISSFVSQTISSAQYIKNELELGINLDLSQSYSQPANTLHYVSIQNESETQVYYYYVKKTQWRSKSAVRLELVMDVLNTFKDGVDYNFKENTRIVREHRNRFNAKTRTITISWYIDAMYGTLDDGDEVNLVNDNGDICFTGIIETITAQEVTIRITSNESDDDIKQSINDYTSDPFELNEIGSSDYYRVSIDTDDFEIKRVLWRNIDYIAEGINPLLQCGDAIGVKLEKPEPLNVDWYLLYRNQNDPDDSLVNPVDCFLIPSSSIETDSGVIVNGRLIPSFIEEGKYYYFQFLNTETITLSNGVTLSFSSGSRNIVLITKASGKLTASHIISVDVNNAYVLSFYDDLEYITFSPVPVSYAKEDNFIPTSEHNTLYYLVYDKTFNNTSNSTLDSIDKLDRTDAKNIKLIKLPYCPYNFSVSGSNILEIDSDPNWELSSLTQAGGGVIYCLHLLDLTLNLESQMSYGVVDYNPFIDLKMTSLDISVDDLRGDASLESKLLHSEFYQPTFCYDSFAFKVAMEKCDVDSYIDNGRNLIIKFNMTKTINSKFMFTFTSYYLKNAEENYAKYLPIARNNEEVLYNVPYINYIRSGYNYEIKAKNIQQASAWFGVGASALTTISAWAFAPAPLKVAGVIAGLVSMVTTIKTAIQTTISNENALSQKKAELQNQASSVAGSDDVDLMSVYAENRLKYLAYKPTEVIQDLLFKLFFYAGYNTNRLGVPSHNNRLNFDYLECEAVIESTNKNMTSEIISEIVNCYKNGVTFIHFVGRRDTNQWDLEQKYENWESDLMGE